MGSGAILVAAFALLLLRGQAIPGEVQGWNAPGTAGRSSRADTAPEDPDARSNTHRTADRTLADLVYLRLAASPSLVGARFEVAAEAAKITLGGTVATERARQRAVRIALWTPGVRDVEDRLTVDPTLAPALRPQIADNVLAERVALTLANEVFTHAHAELEWVSGWAVEGPRWEFDVEVGDGTVTLVGRVPRFGDVRRAVEGARRVFGVRNVRAELSVRNDRPEIEPPFGPYGPLPPGPVTWPNW